MFDSCVPSLSPVPADRRSPADRSRRAGAGCFVVMAVFRKDSEAPASKVIAFISVGSAAFFILAMILPIIAALVIPPCFQ